METLWPGRRDAGSGAGSSGRFVRIPFKCALQDSGYYGRDIVAVLPFCPVYKFYEAAWSRRRARLSSRPRTASTSNIGGDVVRPVSAARNGCATTPSLARSLRIWPHNGLGSTRVPFRNGFQFRQDASISVFASSVSSAFACSLMSIGRLGPQEPRGVEQFDQSLGPLLHGRAWQPDTFRAARGHFAREFLPAGDMWQEFARSRRSGQHHRSTEYSGH